MKKSVITSKIGIKLLLSILVSLIMSMFVNVLLNLTNLSAVMPEPLDFFLTLGAFILCFLLIINTKVKYIKYIAERVKKISNDELGAIIEIRGNDELAELSESINFMSKELKYRKEKEKEIEEAKNELITNVSHDLRTPLLLLWDMLIY
ncbi:HAMP domain-containing protein [Clostridium sp. OS1-26]|uniref:HAMP domain-containing protein n=1 Tax=Clostridium sp. OS1-26 TaxID=3070681 RepID=UPI0027DFD20C|nr:HAMP domain-containing protein [Clostridium sp. OS1-26]WML34400.1 HAMP domain-containing protein [Clostridium sp. OS1-26]